jgi:hypothetical protein
MPEDDHINLPSHFELRDDSEQPPILRRLRTPNIVLSSSAKRQEVRGNGIAGYAAFVVHQFSDVCDFVVNYNKREWVHGRN